MKNHRSNVMKDPKTVNLASGDLHYVRSMVFNEPQNEHFFEISILLKGEGSRELPLWGNLLRGV